MIKRFAVIVLVAFGFGQCQGRADDCGRLGGIPADSECQIAAAVSASGTYSLAETLHLLDAGRIAVPAGAGLSLKITGSLILDGGARITGDAAAPRDMGANISISATGDILLHGTGSGGAAITSSQTANTCASGSGGSITLSADSNADASGSAVLESGSSVAAAGAQCPAGAIVIKGARVNIEGLVEAASTLTSAAGNPFDSPRQQAAGGGPVTIAAGCDLVVGSSGVVRSKGQETGADLVHLEGGCDVSLFGHVESTGAGYLIPNAPTNHCYYRASGFPTPASVLEPANDPVNPRLDKPWNSTACVEVWAGKTLTLDGAEINADTGSSGGSQGTAWIDLFAGKDVTIAGPGSGNFAVHANGLGSRRDSGGLITVKSMGGKLTVSGQGIQADSLASGGQGGGVTMESSGALTLDTGTIVARGDNAFGSGGTIAARSFSGALSWQSGSADLQPVGDSVIHLSGCNSVVTGFTIAGSQAGPVLDTACGGLPSLPAYAVLPGCQCYAQPVACKWCTQAAALKQLSESAGSASAVPDILVDLRLAASAVDSSKAGTDQPATGSLQAAVNYLVANGDINHDGVLLIGVMAQDCGTGVAGAGSCAGQSGRAPSGGGTENVVIRNTRSDRLNIVGCGVTLTARDPARPVLTISNSTGQVFVSGIAAQGSTGDPIMVKDNASLVVVK